MRRDTASERQLQAADPAANTWLSANAGSGKTKVLTDRVARLLLGGVAPDAILCLTFTNAAASEMQNRLFARLGGWAMTGDGALSDELRALGVAGPLRQAELREARRLFARAIDTPGGLKIRTIHAFAAAILRRFPLEAGVSPRFAEIDERAAARLRRDVIDDIAEGPERAALAAVARHIGDDSGLDALAAEVAKNRAAFAADGDAAAIRSAFGLSTGDDGAAALATAFDGSEHSLFEAMLPLLAGQSKTYAELGARLDCHDWSAPDGEALEMLFGEFLYRSADRKWQSKSANFPQSNHRRARQALEPILGELHALMDRVAAAKQILLSSEAATKTEALHAFASAFLPAYARAKAGRGALDFDDLILKTRDLLARPGVADWVLFRLDGGLDHILVDEAQDTSPVQWEVIELLTRELTAGHGARPEAGRTLFVVGDRKQSIYSFQGADPDAAERMEARFRARLTAADRGLQRLILDHSFRSAPAILRVVDQTFPPGDRAGLGYEMEHVAFQADMPGRVDLWPVVPTPATEERPEWWQPTDMPAPSDPAVVLADRVAGAIGDMVGGGETIRDKSAGARRPLRAGDVLILLQRRSDLFHEIIRACKAAGLPMAGADRLKVGAEMAVKDITALLSFLALPEDDLSLATALRSPLFGWGEAALHDLAAGRGARFLWHELRERPAFAASRATLDALRGDADYLRPYDLIERILTRHGGRRRLVARLGTEAEDGIDALLSQAMAYERQEIPSLTGFLTWMDGGEAEIKREPHAAGDRVRVMTVHAAKGLEAPVVILPDTAKRQPQDRDQIWAEAGRPPLWRMPVAECPAAMRETDDRRRAREADERRRLLYVAMTRAAQWLIVAAAGETGDGDESWYARIAAGMERAGAVAQPFAGGEGRRYETDAWPAPSGRAGTAAEDGAAAALPAWATTRLAAPAETAGPRAPSDLGGAKALPDEAARSEAVARARGTHLHLLLEHLPGLDPAARPERARALLGTELDEGEFTDCLAEAEAVLDAAKLGFLFDGAALAEVELSARLPELDGERVRGAVDRLLVAPDRVLAVDFKSNTAVPETPEAVPEGLLRQLGAYAAALRAIYPDRRVETAILWTRTATFMPMPAPLLETTLSRAELA